MLKKFISYYKPYRKLLFIDMLAAVGIALCNLLYPTLAKDIINKYVYEDTPTTLLIFSAILLLVYIIKAFCSYIVSYWGHVMGVYMQRDMRRDLFSKYQRLPTSFFDNNKTGELLSRLSNDLFEVSELAHHGPENLLLAVLMFVGSFIVLSTINFWLTLIVFAAVPVVIVITGLSRKTMHSSMKNYRRQVAVVNAEVENSLSGIRETKSFVAEHIENEKFSEANGLFASLRRRAMFAMGRYETIMTFFMDILYLVVILAGGLFFFFGKINAGEFTAFVLYISMFLSPIQKFVFLFQQMEEGMTGFSRFTEIMNEEEETDCGTLEIDTLRGNVEFHSVSFSYSTKDDGREVISNFNLKISEGETVALVGPSGGGKTTVCNLIPRFYDVKSGYITADGIDIRDIKLHSLRRHIGIVSQSIFLFDGTVRENIAYGTENPSEEDIILAARRANIHDYIVSLPDGYDTQVGERGVKLSGGQRQRIAIARVFLKNPPFLILDEATSALDNATEMQVQKSLEELSLGRTVIVVAHRLSTIKNATKIVVIDKDGIIEEGSHDELIKKGGEYKRLYDYQWRHSEEIV